MLMATGNLRYAEPMSKSPGPHPPTMAELEAAALRYLERFAASAESLRRVLLRRVARSARANDGEPAEGEALVADLLARYEAAGLLDDRRYAEAKSRSLSRAGRSLKGIRHYLAAKGVAGEVVEAAVSDLDTDMPDADLAAALAYARRCRLGPFRPADARREHRRRDLAALGRAGFSWDVARAVVDGDPMGG
jgi:regulatory protein